MGVPNFLGGAIYFLGNSVQWCQIARDSSTEDSSVEEARILFKLAAQTTETCGNLKPSVDEKRPIMPKVRRRRQQQAKWGFLRTKQTTAIKENHQDTTHTHIVVLL